MDMRPLALTLHVFGFTTWLIGLFGIAIVLLDRDASESSLKKHLGGLARRIGGIADGGAFLAILAGLWLIAIAPGFYMKQPWLHMKLTLVVGGMLGLHGFLRVKAKRASEGEGTFPKVVLPVMILVSLVVMGLAILKPLQK